MARWSAAVGRRMALIAGLTVLGLGQPAGAEESGFTAHVSFDEVFELAAPLTGRGVSRNHLQFTPLPGEGLRVVRVRTFPPSRVRADTADVTLGALGEGELRRVQWFRRDDGATYVRIAKSENHMMTLTVRIRENACDAEIRFELLPGFTEYQSMNAWDPTKKIYMKSLRAEHVRCWIGELIVS